MQGKEEGSYVMKSQGRMSVNVKSLRERLLFQNVRVRNPATLFPSKTAINGVSYLFKKLFKVFENYPKSKYHIKIFFRKTY